jgi:phage nucleotide-binding protein
MMSQLIKRTKDVSFENGLKILVYGDAGSGKTRMISTIEGNPLIISAEGGLLSLRQYDYPYVEIHSMKDMQEVFRFIRGSEDANQYDWICIDSISEVAEVCLTENMRGIKDKRQAYGELQTTVTDMIKAFRDLPKKNVYMTAKLDRVSDSMTGALMYSPDFPGSKLTPKSPYLFDEFFYLRSQIKDGQPERLLITQEDINIRAKDRSGSLNVFEQPNLKIIKDKILGVASNDSI